MQKRGLNGFYAGFFAAAAGESAALFVIRDGVVVGADLGAFQYDGVYEMTPSGEAQGRAKVRIPPRKTSILGVSSGDTGLTYDVDFVLPTNFLEKPSIQLNTSGR